MWHECTVMHDMADIEVCAFCLIYLGRTWYSTMALAFPVGLTQGWQPYPIIVWDACIRVPLCDIIRSCGSNNFGWIIVCCCDICALCYLQNHDACGCFKRIIYPKNSVTDFGQYMSVHCLIRIIQCAIYPVGMTDFPRNLLTVFIGTHIDR